LQWVCCWRSCSLALLGRIRFGLLGWRRPDVLESAFADFLMLCTAGNEAPKKRRRRHSPSQNPSPSRTVDNTMPYNSVGAGAPMPSDSDSSDDESDLRGSGSEGALRPVTPPLPAAPPSRQPLFVRNPLIDASPSPPRQPNEDNNGS
jgi:hypothetical protein